MFEISKILKRSILRIVGMSNIVTYTDTECWPACCSPECKLSSTGWHWHVPDSANSPVTSTSTDDFWREHTTEQKLSTKTGKQGIFVVEKGRAAYRLPAQDREIRRRERARNRKDYYEANINELAKSAKKPFN
jgi:hypothetical protein